MDAAGRDISLREEEDEVFLDDGDYMRKLRLGLVPPYAGYPYGFHAYGFDYEEDYGIKDSASCLDLFVCLWHIGSYMLDVGTDIYLSYLYFSRGHYAWFGLTLAFVLLPALTITTFSLVLYVRDWKIVKERPSAIRWASRVIFLFLQLAPLIRLVQG